MHKESEHPSDHTAPLYEYPALGYPQWQESPVEQKFYGETHPPTASHEHYAHSPAPPHLAEGEKNHPARDRIVTEDTTDSSKDAEQPLEKESKNGSGQREKILALFLVVAAVFVARQWWAANENRKTDTALPVVQMPIPVEKHSLASLTDNQILSLLPLREDFPYGWEVSTMRGSLLADLDFEVPSAQEPQCDIRSALHEAPSVGVVTGTSSTSPLGETNATHVRISRSNDNQHSLGAALEFVHRCPVLTFQKDSTTTTFRLSGEQGTVADAEDSLTLTLKGSTESGGVLSVPLTLSIIGLQSRGLFVTGTSLRSGPIEVKDLYLEPPPENGRGSVMPRPPRIPQQLPKEENRDILVQLMQTTVRRINAR